MGFTNRPVFLFSLHPTEPHGPLLHIRVCFSLFDFSHLTFSPSVLSQDSSNFSFPESIASFNSGLWQPRQTRFLPIVPSPQVTWHVLHGLQSPQPCSEMNDELFESYHTLTYFKNIKISKNVVLLWGHIFGHFRSCFLSPLHPSPWYERQCLVLVILPLFPHSPWQELHWPQLHQAASPRLGHSDTSLSIRQILYSFLSFLSHFSPPSFGYVFIDLRLLNISH